MKLQIKKRILAGVSTMFLLCAFSADTAAQEVITLQNAIERALANNLQVKQASLAIESSELNLRQSQNSLYPAVNGSISQNMGWGRNQVASGLFQNTQNYNLSAGLGAGVDVFNGFAKINQIRQNKLLLSAEQSNMDKVKNDLVLAVVSAYMQVLFNSDFLQAAEAQLKVGKQQLSRQEQLFNSGSKTLADVSQAKSQAAEAQLNLTNAENALIISKINLAQLMEIPSETNLQLETPVVEQVQLSTIGYNAAEVFNTALQYFPDIKLAEKNVQAAELGVAIARSSYYPRISLSANYGSSYFDSQNPFINNASFEKQLKDNVSKSIGMTVSIPIFNGLQAKTNVKRAKISLMQTQNQANVIRNNLNKIIYQAVADVNAARTRYSGAKDAFEAQKDAFFAIEQRYGVGLANAIEYSTALTNRNRAEIDMIQARYDALFKAKVIDFYLGKPITF